jgi:acyl-CoA synthetase (AMP-forming)/AMP-acid ligase II
MKRESQLWTTWCATARRGPRRVAVIHAASGVSCTAAALTEQAVAFAERLNDFGLGQRVAFQMPNGAAWLAFFLALQKQGLAAMPLDNGLPAEGCLELSRRLRARAFLNGKELQEIAAKAPGERSRSCCIKITSGSTDVPKAIACRAEHLLADGRQVVATMGIRPRDRNLAAVPLGHSYGLGNLVMPLILQGTSLVCAGEFLPRQLVEWIGRHAVTVFPSVPAIFRVLASLPPGARMTGLRTAISAGAMLSPEVARAFHARFGIRIHNFYGSSETGGISYDRSGLASLEGRSVGKPLRGVSITVTGGRITVTSPAVATRTGRWRLGDRGEWNTRGELVLLGRVGREANIGGKKVHPLEVERVLRSVPGVNDVEVWLEHRQGRDLLAAAIETSLARTKIEHALAGKLPAWKWPGIYFLAAQLPRTARGKLDRALIKKNGAR